MTSRDESAAQAGRAIGARWSLRRLAPARGRSQERLLQAAAGLGAGLVLLPVLALVFLAATGSYDLWPHLARHVLPHALMQTTALVVGVGAVVSIVGLGTGWLVATCRFPGRGIFEWALVLPMAVPTYIQAYVYLDALHPLGPIPTALRWLLGIDDPRGLRLPEIRSLGGCILLLGSVLYPYVYLATRAGFMMQSANMLEVARTLGAGRARVFFRIGIPLARPALAVGLGLVLMETINDIGASEFLGIQTVTVTIYATWLNRSDLPEAAQIALFMLVITLALLMLERWGRLHARYTAADSRGQRRASFVLSGPAAAGAVVTCALPVAAGFVFPAAHLLYAAWQRAAFAGISDAIVSEAVNTALYGCAGAALTVVLGFIIAAAMRAAPGRWSAACARIAMVGYAMPGTVLAVGLLAPLAAFDNGVSDLSMRLFGVSTGLLLFSSGAVLVLAYAIRFLAIAASSIEAGYAKIPPSMDMAARSLGERLLGTIRRVHVGLLLPACGSAAVLVFVDCMKELPATLLLRPLNVETLATHLYGEAVRGTYEDGAVAAFLIVLIGLAPIVLLVRLSRAAWAAPGRAP